MKTIANVFQVGALVCVTASAFMLALWVGVFILGLCLALIGYALDPDRSGGNV